MDIATINRNIEQLEKLLTDPDLSAPLRGKIEINMAFLQLRLDKPDFRLSDVDEIIARDPSRRSGILGDMEVEAARRDGLLVIEPFRPDDQLGSSSYDCLLGFTYRKARTDRLASYSPYDEADVRDRFGEPCEAVQHADYCKTMKLALFPGIDPDEFGIPLEPHQTILAHTDEFIGALFGGTTMMKAKSTTGRNDIEVCGDAGMGDVGYGNRWTLEVRNLHTRSTVFLPAGLPISQLIFFWAEGASINYGFSGHYQDGIDIPQLMREWTPDDMLPRGFYSPKNRRIRQQLSKLGRDPLVDYLG